MWTLNGQRLKHTRRRLRSLADHTGKQDFKVDVEYSSRIVKTISLSFVVEGEYYF